MKSIKLLFLAPSFAMSVFSLAELAKADPNLEAENHNILTVGELRSQASQQSASLLQPNLNFSAITKPEPVAQTEPDSDEIEIEVTGKKSPFIPTSAPAYIVPKEEIQKQFKIT